MYLRHRLLVVAAAATTILGLTVGNAWAGPGQFPTAASCATPPAGTSCVVVTGTSDHQGTPVRVGDRVGYTFTLNNYGDTDGGVFDTALHVDYNLDLDSGSVEVNGAPATTVYRPGGVQDIRDYFTIPAHGSATVTFSATVLAPFDGGPVPMTTYVQVNGSQTSNDVVVSPPVLDLSLSNGFGADEVDTNPATGATIDLAVNNRGSSSPDAILTMPVPTGWTVQPVSDSLGDDVTCSVGSASVTCRYSAVSAVIERHVQFVVRPGADVPVGDLVPLSAELTPVGGADEFPSDNSVTLQLRNTGVADLAVQIRQTTSTVGAHGLVKFTVTMTNHGPQPSTGVEAVLRVRTDTQDGFTQLRPIGPGTVTEGDGEPQPAGPTYTWQPGDLAAGQTVQLTVWWRAQVSGATGHLEARVFEQPYNPSAQNGVLEIVPSATVTVVGKA
jgi:Domain of unknown function DUF11